MKKIKHILPLLVAAIVLASCNHGRQIKLELPAIISDNMVLQQNQEVVLWGKARPGSKMTLEASWKAVVKTRTSEDSSWIIRLKTPDAGGPFTLAFTNRDTVIRIENVMTGEVWICSGQSNMEMPVMGWPPTDTILNSRKEIAEANYPDIRMFTVTKAFSVLPGKAFDGKWEVCSPETAGMFSATAYFFGKKLHQELGVPVGLIHSSWGGTPVESWMSRQKINEYVEFREIMQRLDSAAQKSREIESWLMKCPELKIDVKSGDPWRNLNFGDDEIPRPGFNHEQWKNIAVPARFENSEIGSIDGAVWYRRFVSLPEKWKNRELVVELGPIDDMDITWFNGNKIGSHESDGEWQVVRKYSIPAKNVFIGNNLLAIRVLDIRGGGGITGKPEDLKIYPADNPADQIGLSGEWKYLPVAILYKGSFRLFDISSMQFYNMAKLPVEIGPNTPTALFNAMINPLIPYTLRGAIWYQGESNSGNPELYTRLFPDMIGCWREAWQQGDFPFYFVQIAPFDYGDWSNAAGLREAQFKTLSVPNTGMAVTLDIGNPVNIHPANKPEVGRRLALWALAKDYGKQVAFSGPLYASMETKGNTVIISFNYAENGLQSAEGGLQNFQVAGEDKKFVQAKAIIEGDKIIVQSHFVMKPVAVRYLWDNASEASLFNTEGLPASSFRTDNW